MSAEALFTTWDIPWGVTIALALTAAIYVRGWVSIRQTRPELFPVWRMVAFLGGVVAIFVAVASPLDTFSESLLFMHMAQHFVLMSIAPPLVVLGAPVVPDEPLTVKILEVPTAGVTRSFILRFQLCTATEMVGTWDVTLQAHIWREVWVAHSDLPRGELLADAEVARDRRDVLATREMLADFSPGDATLELADSVPADGILLATPAGDVIRAQSPFGRVATPDEIAAAVVYLASPEAEWASGAVLDLNGASHLR